MKPVSPVVIGSNLEEINVAENQPEYMTLPVVDCGEGVILSRWHLTDEEREIIYMTGDLYLYMWTHYKPVTPVMLTVEIPVIVETDTRIIDDEQ